ncbi:hypothetical protein GCM10022419_134280 [Nonomuraea rosea]|uniref:Uncharacterized protein n=1 Tax=Nonomuraea rosea TaxID=638574 RepID=A0ABP7A6Q1_9ACTN
MENEPAPPPWFCWRRFRTAAGAWAAISSLPKCSAEADPIRGRAFGATDVVSARGEEGIEAVRELTGGHGTHVVLEAVGNVPVYQLPAPWLGSRAQKP